MSRLRPNESGRPEWTTYSKERREFDCYSPVAPASEYLASQAVVLGETTQPKMSRYFVLLDQVLYSLTTFVVGVMAARALSVEEYGAFSLVFAVTVLALGLHRSMFTEPLLIFAGRGLNVSALARRSLGGALSIGFLFSIASAVAYTLSLGPIAIPLAILTIAPFIADSARFIILSVGSGSTLLLYEAVAISIQFASLLTLGVFNVDSWIAYLATWSASTLAAPTVFGVFLLRRLWRQPRLTSEEKREVRRASNAFGVDYTLGAISLQVTLLTATISAGFTASAALRGADTLVGPYRVLLQALPAMLLRKWSSDDVAYRHRMVIRTCALLFPVVATGSAILLLIPENIGTQVLGDTWTVARPILPLVLASLLPITVTYVVTLALKSSGASRTLVRVRGVVLPITIGCGVAGALYAGAPGAAAGSLIGSTIAATLYFIALIRVEQQNKET